MPREGVDTKGGNQGSVTGIKAYAHRGTGDKGITGHSGYYDSNGDLIGNGYANKRSVWTICTKPFKEAHFAVYPEELIIPCILAGCPAGGLVYDPFGGSGTTGVVALRAGRRFVMSELNSQYCEIARKRLLPYVHNLFT